MADAIMYGTAINQEAEVVTGDADLKDLPGVVDVRYASRIVLSQRSRAPLII